MAGRVAGKVAFVTGAARGQGRRPRYVTGLEFTVDAGCTTG
jgi:hypothetical protein